MRQIILLTLIVCWSSLTNVYAQAPAASPAPPTARRTGAIAGRVIVEDGALAGGTQVSLSPVGATSFGSNMGSLADEEGNFTINNLEARAYRVFASMPGYVSTGEDETWRHARIGDVLTVNLVKGGVITGKVTAPSGDPVIGLMISATRVRDAEGKSVVARSNNSMPAQTDDRGVYRIYGLSAGAYVVGAGDASFVFTASPYLGDKPVYHPSSARETAAEVLVQPGAVASGIDIQYRSDPGLTVSGKITGALASSEQGGVNVNLSAPGTPNHVASTFVQPTSSNNGFELRGVPNGDYDVSAYRYGQMGLVTARSQPRRIRVANSDVGGVELTLAPLASISGTVALESLPDPKPEEKTLCVKGRPHSVYEVLLNVRTTPAAQTTGDQTTSSETVPDDKGAFAINGLDPGNYRLFTNLPDEGWYLKSIAVNQAAPATNAAANAKRPAAGEAGLFALKSGEKVAGVTVTLAEGAAQVSGKLVGKSSRRWHVHLVPADAALANDALRYGETRARADGTFKLGNLAPGKYWLIAKPLAADESLEAPPRPLAWDATARAALRKEAEAAAQVVELGACMRLSDYQLK